MKSRLTLLLLFLCSSIMAQEIDPERLIPVDPKITVGKLDNGLTYYIRQNYKPEKRAELRLAVNAGSVLENDDQQGLAHFLEHMAFNGTKNFARHELTDYLESIGMRFGPDLNAYTSFDETVYMLQIPTDSTEIIETAFQILEDWAHQISLEEEEIDKERGVIVEEWRRHRGAGARMRDKQLPILLQDSHYAERLPIGKKDILDNFGYESLRNFYRQWYRPDLMAVVAVGDFDREQIEKLIKIHFSRIPEPDSKPERLTYAVPDHEETLFAIATDPEATGSGVSVYYKHDPQPQNRIGDFRRLFIERLYNSMLNNRLQEILQQPQPPFLYALSSKGGFVRTKDFYTLGASVKDNGILDGLNAILIESQRVKKFGFAESELARGKTNILRNLEKAFNERNKSQSRIYAAEYLRNFLTDEPIPGIEWEYEIASMLVPAITLEEVNSLASKWISDKNRVITVNAPEKEGLDVPDEAELTAVFAAVSESTIEPYVDLVTDVPLFEEMLKPKPVVASRYIDEIEVTEWDLENGVRIILKPTDFKNDEIQFTSYSPGGHSLVGDEDYIAAISATTILQQAGIADFNLIEFRKLMTGKLARVTPYIGELEEGLMGSSTPQDLETMFQLIYLYFYAPRVDSTAFQSYQYRIKEFLKNRDASPTAAFQDTIQVTMGQYHFRRRPWSEAMFDEMDMQKSLAIYQDRFDDASDFTFIFVGNFTPDSLRPFVETYLANLPDKNRSETWRDTGILPPEGVIKKEVKRGIEPKSSVQIHYSGEFDWSAQNDYDLRAMASVLNLKLREVLREDLGGTYSVTVSAFSSREPTPLYRIIISFGCDPKRVEELTEQVSSQIDSLKSYQVDDIYITKVKEQQIRAREKSLKENSFWLNKLETYYYNEWDPVDILNFQKYVDGLTKESVQETAKKYFNDENQASFFLYPEE